MYSGLLRIAQVVMVEVRVRLWRNVIFAQRVSVSRAVLSVSVWWVSSEPGWAVEGLGNVCA